jgi:hypothetical protein
MDDVAAWSVDGLKDLIQLLESFPQFLGSPYDTSRALVEGGAGIGAAATYAVGLTVASYFASSLLNLKKASRESIKQFIVGTLFIWIVYALFVHLFVSWFGESKGASRTVTAYLYTIGSLQPVFFFILFIMGQAVPNGVIFKSEWSRVSSLQGYGRAKEFLRVNGRVFSPTTTYVFRFVSSVLTFVYLGFALAAVHEMSFVRSFAASAIAYLSFFVFYMVFAYRQSIVDSRAPLPTKPNEQAQSPPPS